MKQANFYPGPSRVYSNITEYIYEAYMEGIMSLNHRSGRFMEIMEETKKVLRARLLIPADYELVFTSSATECWEIIAQSLTMKKSQHFFNGAFGEKWHEYASRITNAEGVVFNQEVELPVGRVDAAADVICFTQNETSNGTQVALPTIEKLRKNAGSTLVAVDITSSLAGINLDFSKADVWFGSCQKCFGLPSGLGIMIMSPKAVEKAYELNERKHYNSLAFILDNAKKNQTSYTPNVLGIYLLLKTQTVSKGIRETEKKLMERLDIYEKVMAKTGLLNVVQNPAVRSRTVLAIQCADPETVKKKALEADIILGSGYGPLKSSTFRIANFPAIKTKEMEKLVKFLEKYYTR